MIALLDAFSGLTLIAFLGFALVIPLVGIAHSGIVNHFPIFDSDVLYATRLTALQALISALLSLGVGTVFGIFIQRASFGRRLTSLRTLLALPFGVPAVVAASAWVSVLGKSGLNSSLLYSISSVILAHVFFNAPWVALWVSYALEDISFTHREAARTLGASRWQEFWSITLPEIFPTLISVFSQVFTFCAMSFILVLILGGGPPVETLETALYIKVRSGGLDLSGASACAFWQLLLTLLPWILLSRFQKRTLGKQARRRLGAENSAHPNLLFIAAILGSAIFLIPYLVLLRNQSVSHFFELLRVSGKRAEILSAFFYSLKISLPTAGLSLLIAIAGVWLDHRFRKRSSQGWANFVVNLMVVPSGVSTMVLGLGFFVAYREVIDPFSSSIFSVVVLQAVFFVAVAFKILRPVAIQFQESQIDVARTLGAGLLRSFFLVEWRRWRRPLIACFSLILGAALGEVGAVSLFYNEERVPASLLISRWMSRYRFEDAQSVALMLMVCSLLFISFGVSNERS
jgi:thiamine transport system permease protein